ncbi:alanine racemase [Balneolales bacterium ANBcel1]|nr:alanine racemase [Balneolales bacterium ANBcel1]
MVKHSSRIFLSQSALKQNFSFIREKIGPHPVISSVVKANAFGHGIATFVPMAEKCGIRHFSVASSYEAWKVREALTHDESRIMIMGILYPEDLPWVIENGVEFFVFDFEQLENARAAAEEVGRQAVIHLELETGGNRTGLPPEELEQAIRFLKKHKKLLRFEGLCTHFAGIESLANQFRIQRQLKTFNDMYKQVRRMRYLPNIRHTACSAAALAFPETVMDLVRVGTAQFGLWPSPDIYNMHLLQTGKVKDTPLKRVMTWKTDVMHVKKVKRDQFVGYGTSYQAPRDMTIAVIPIGYSNGYPKALSNRGHVLIHGKKAPVTGLINMNVFMVDVSQIPDVAVGDDVILIGKQKNNSITIKSFTEITDSINNELVSRLPTAIPRRTVR